VQSILRGLRSTRLALLPPGKHSLGAPLALEFTLENDTEDDVVFQFAGGAPTQSTFVLRLHTEPPSEIQLMPDEVELLTPLDEQGIVAAGAMLRCRLLLRGPRSPVTRPGDYRVSLRYVGAVARAQAGAWVDFELQEWTSAMESNAVTVEARGRRVEELEAAMAAGSREARESAVAEIEVRDDAELLPILRKHGSRPGAPLRLAAVRRLGAAGRTEDLPFVLAAMDDPDADVRAAAISALGGFAGDEARRTLMGLIADDRHLDVAVAALKGHKHPASVACLVSLVKRRPRDEPWVGVALGVLYDWTGILVRNRPAEIEAFERWWAQNQRRWIEETQRESR
ncbi:MAG: HEAT repeat domain-containing protein, partial [Planctomycetota bacterium]